VYEKIGTLAPALACLPGGNQPARGSPERRIEGEVNEELKEKVVGARVGKVQQAGEQAIALKLNRHWLLISAEPRWARIHLVGKPDRTARQPSRFVLLLRKYLRGAQLQAIEQLGYDRIFILRFAARVSPHGDSVPPVALTLVAELIGRAANIYLTDHSNRVIERFLERTEERNAPGEIYVPPASRGKVNPLTLDREEFERIVRGEKSLAEAVMKRVDGFGPVEAREVEARWQRAAQPGERVSLAEAYDAFKSVVDDLFNKPAQPTIYSRRELAKIVPSDVRPGDLLFSTIPLVQAAGMRATRFDSISEAEEVYYRLLQETERFKEQRTTLISRVKTLIEKKQRLIRNLETDREALGHAEQMKRFGELLLGNAQTAKRTDGGFVVTDYYDPLQRPIEIPAQPKLTPQQAAEEYFTRYRKAKRGREVIAEQIAKAEREIERLRQWLERAQAAKTGEDLLKINQEIESSRAAVMSRPVQGAFFKKERQQESRPGVYRFLSSDNYEILVGKSDTDNERLTFHVARPHDIWLHAADYPGSHVIIRRSKREQLPHRSLIEAAQLAAYFSQARRSTKVVVNYTERKFVSKIRHARPGLVRLADFKSVVVEPVIKAVRLM